MKRYIPFILLAVLGLMINACYYDEELELPNEPITEDVSFSTEIQPLFNQNCTQCHGETFNFSPILLSGESYDNLIDGGYVIPENAEESILYRSLIGDGIDPMPPPEGWDENDDRVLTIKAWIDQGAKDN